MSDAGEAAQAIGALLIGGILFIMFGSALSGTTLGGTGGGLLVNFTFWGVLYLLAALVLGIMVVAAIISSIFDQ